MHRSVPGNIPDHVGVADRLGRGLVGIARVAQRAFDKEIHDRDADIGQQQRSDGFVDASRVVQRARDADPQSAHDEPAKAMTGNVMIGGTTPTIGTATAAAASRQARARLHAPMMIRPICAGIATARAVRINGEERGSVFCRENEVPKPPIQQVDKVLEAIFREPAKTVRRLAPPSTAQRRDDERFQFARAWRRSRSGHLTSKAAFAAPRPWRKFAGPRRSRTTWSRWL